MHRDEQAAAALQVPRNVAGTQGFLRAFVSSTYEDLKEHRAYVIARLRNAGVFVDPMEDWTSDSGEPRCFSRERVDGCDFCVLLVALRRGHVPAAELRSITQLEYQRACELHIDVLPFLLSEQAPWPRRFDELDSDAALKHWRTELEESRGVGYFDHRPDSVNIDSAFNRWIVGRYFSLLSQIGVGVTSQLPGLGPKTILVRFDEAIDSLQDELRGPGPSVR